MINFGTVRPGSTIYVYFDSFAASTGAPATISGLATTDILIYKDGSTTERASQTGFTLLDTDGIDFDAKTGINGFSVDLSSDATADFYKAGSSYVIVIASVTIDGQTVQFIAATFDIGFPDALLNTSIATLASQTSFTLTAGPAEDDALNGMWAVVHDKASAVQRTWVQILDYTGSTKTVTLAATPAATFTIAAIDNFCVMGVMPLQPVTTGRQLVVDAAGLGDANAVKVGPTGSGTAQTAGDLKASLNTVQADTDDIQTRIPAALTANGNMKSSMVEILTTALTETAGLLAGGFKKFFNIASPVSTMDVVARVTLTDTLTTYTGNTVQTGDSYARIGAAGVSLSAIPDEAGVTTLLSRLSALRAGYLDNLSAGAAALQSSLSALITTVGVAGAGLTAADDAVITAIAALNNLSQANIRTAVGLGSANLDTQLDALPTNAELATALAATDDAVLAAIAALNNLSSAQVATALATFGATQPTESYAADLAVPTRDQFMFMIYALLNTFTFVTTTQTVKKLDKATTAMTFTVDSATTPTSHTRAT